MKAHISLSPEAKKERRRKRALERVTQDVERWSKTPDSKDKLEKAQASLKGLQKNLGLS